ncbi:TPA: hypothetical protein I8034_003089 [Legionella pneumophila]|nr:hypothetical protein [Legionella pneumophila]HAT2137563.1 hypothetical protein [Legionella pneumophila]HAT2143680.1 hypothetical protein [Legionella pneumophila]HAT2146825.1 hypothetical protein [Legionella pneumophila]HAT2161943.1 hypothetical protein [Legionella pneumophila]
MPIDIERLQAVYNEDVANDSFAAIAWTMIPDSKTNEMSIGAVGASGGNPNNGWKIHISIDPAKMREAAVIIAELLNEADAPRVSLKFAGKQLAHTGQPSKQVAFIFYEEELRNQQKIQEFLSRIEQELSLRGIGVDQRAINSDVEAAKTKYDASILMEDGSQSRFNYRNENCLVLEDSFYKEMGYGQGNFRVEGEMIFVKQSYYLSLPNEQKHNPGNCQEDPFAVFTLRVPQLLVVEPEQNHNNQPSPILMDAWDSLEDDFKSYVSIQTRDIRVEYFAHAATSEYWRMMGDPERLQLYADYLNQLHPKNPSSSPVRLLGLFAHSDWHSLDKDFKSYVSVSTRAVRYELLNGISTDVYWGMMGDSEQKSLMKEYLEQNHERSLEFN